ncbi:MAG: hypothetical protein C0502_06700 [Opitutus sp.]|nr:hypothetical protein [Opitutus sp.]
MRSKVTVVLLFLNVLLFYYIFHYEQKWQAERAQFEARRRVLGPEAASIEKFSRSSPNAPTVTAEKRADGWWLAQPLEWPANPNAVANVLNELQLLEHETSFAVADLAKGGQSLADYGLAQPAMTFTFTSGGRDFALKIGDRTELGNRLYLLSPDGARVHVVGRGVADTLGLPVEQLRSEAIFTVPVFEVRSLAVQTAPPANLKIRFRREGPRWGFETPILARANKAGVEGAVTALNALRTTRFVEPRDPDAGRTGLETPPLRLTLEGNSRRETLLLGAPVNPDAPAGDSAEFFAKIEDKPAVFVTAVPTKLLETLRAAQETLRDQHVLDFEPGTVTALTLTAPNQPELNLQRLEATQGTESWQLVVRTGAGQAPQTLPADTTVMQGVLERLRDLMATRFVSDAPTAADLENYGFNRPELEVALNLSTGGGPRGAEPSVLTLQVGAKPGERAIVYARIASAPFVCQIEPDLLQSLPVVARHFRQRLLRELPEGTHVTALTLIDLADGAVLVKKTAGADKPLTGGAIAADEPEARRAAWQSLLKQVRSLTAKSFQSESFDPAGASLNGTPTPWRYRLDADLTLTGGSAQTVTSRLFLTERLGGTTQLAGTEEFGGVTFELTQEFVDALFALTYARQHDPGPPAKPAAETPASKPGN